ncbi:LysM peptidoglycan-binding domain-containing protein [Carnobacterium viridans]|uniref:LysM peptidoglycan-binding domain-containing protein n=1 Tax=Carnobacterium viridans TaxID=174587 RepID=UPI001FD1B558|nr:LysM domain-containing protein [Carnobacterium viridans]
MLKIPAKSSTPTIPSPVPKTTNYTVKSGDTLYSIARKHGITVQQIVTTNKLTNANLIKVGQVLKIPTK